MISSFELRRVAAFSDLQDYQIEWFLSHVQEVFLHARIEMSFDDRRSTIVSVRASPSRQAA
jgi:hypothetical protein